MATVHIGVGSNIGDRLEHLDRGVTGIARLGTISAGSPIYETAPVGGPEQGAYLNSVVIIETDLAPQELLEQLLAIERVAGRVREERWGPRTLDLDILGYDGRTIDEPGLTVPHPEIRNRRFVLAPLADVSPGLSDESGPYADALPGVADQFIKRLTGPYVVEEGRWMTSIGDATELKGDGSGEFVVESDTDWSNTLDDMFGAYLSAVVLRGVEAVAEDQIPASLMYRFIHAIPAGSVIEVSVERVRSTARSADFIVTLCSEGETKGKAAVSTVSSARPMRIAPDAPQVRRLSECRPIDELIGSIGRNFGNSARSWSSLERWDFPDLRDGTEDVFRAWTPNVALGSDDPYLRAAAILMPIDALIWRGAMHRLGILGTGEFVVTPTLDFTGRFPNLDSDPGWHLGEVHVDHMSEGSVAGTVRVWADDGTYLSVGTSHNLVIQPR